MIIRGGLGDSAQSLRQSCSLETPAGRFGTVAKAAHVVIGGTE